VSSIREAREEAYLATVKEAFELVQHFAESVESDRFFLRDIGLIFNLIENTK
jgi:hypothetical protein